jgi:hypothetical protein
MRPKDIAVLHFVLLMLFDDPRTMVVDILAAAGPTTGVDLLTNPLGVKFLTVVVLLGIAIIVALAVLGLFKLAVRSSWKVALITAGSAFVGTFFIGLAIINYLMP